MPPRGVAVDYPYSFAHRTGADLRVVLDLTPPVEVGGDAVTLRLRKQNRTVRVDGRVSPHGDRVRLEATVPASELGPGTWRLALLPGGADEQDARPLLARLLVSRDRPVALLTGRRPKVRQQPPTRAARVSSARRVAAAAVSRLPEPLAVRARAAARRVRG